MYPTVLDVALAEVRRDDADAPFGLQLIHALRCHEIDELTTVIGIGRRKPRSHQRS
jgi:hypothetical protein